MVGAFLELVCRYNSQNTFSCSESDTSLRYFIAKVNQIQPALTYKLANNTLLVHDITTTCTEASWHCSRPKDLEDFTSNSSTRWSQRAAATSRKSGLQIQREYWLMKSTLKQLAYIPHLSHARGSPGIE